MGPNPKCGIQPAIPIQEGSFSSCRRRVALADLTPFHLPPSEQRIRCNNVGAGQELYQFTSRFGDLIAWPYEADGIAFEAIPRTLAQNCGVNVVRTTTALQVKHVNGENAWIGIDGNSGSITDVKEKKFWDAYIVKAQTFKTAMGSACLLVRINDTEGRIKKKQPPGSKAPSKPQV